LQWLCRDCLSAHTADTPIPRCPQCGSPRLKNNHELEKLSIAHIDCDAFYASVEKRDNPSLKDKPVVVGGGHRGVVSAACYVARTYGIRSAMPMFKALKLCPHAQVIRPNMTKYATEGRRIKTLFQELTPLVESLSIDEAFLDLTGTEKLHHGIPAQSLALLALRIEKEVGLTVSIGLSYNKFLAKVASDLDKPRGFSIIGPAEAKEFLAPRPVGLIWGVGKSLQKKLEADGITKIAQLQIMDKITLIKNYGSIGGRLFDFSRGIDERRVIPSEETKTVSAETTFDQDTGKADELTRALWSQCEKVSKRLKRQNLMGDVITLKLRLSDFSSKTRSHKLDHPTQLAERLFDVGTSLLKSELNGKRYRLIGIGVAGLSTSQSGQLSLDSETIHQTKIEQAMDKVRQKLGDQAIFKGRSLRIPKQK